MTAMISAKSLKVGQLVGVNFERFSGPTCCADPSVSQEKLICAMEVAEQTGEMVRDGDGSCMTSLTFVS